MLECSMRAPEHDRGDIDPIDAAARYIVMSICPSAQACSGAEPPSVTGRPFWRGTAGCSGLGFSGAGLDAAES